MANVTADVAIIRNFDDPEIAAIEQSLFDLGLTYYVFDQENVTFQVLQSFKLIIWDDLGQSANGLRNKDVDLFQQAYNAQIPIYFIGERLASSTANLTDPYRSEWTQLVHLQPATTQGGSGTVTIRTDVTHRVINGRFGYIVDFAYPAEVDATTMAGTDAPSWPSLVMRTCWWLMKIRARACAPSARISWWWTARATAIRSRSGSGFSTTRCGGYCASRSAA